MAIIAKRKKSNSNNPATKQDLVRLTTGLKADIASVKNSLKSDITAVRTELKSDIASVKKELKSDIASVKKELKSDIASVRTELKLDIGDLKESLEAKIAFLPDKDDFYTGQDKVIKELEIMRGENAVTTGIKYQVNNHEQRLEIVEGKLGIQFAAA